MAKSNNLLAVCYLFECRNTLSLIDLLQAYSLPLLTQLFRQDSLSRNYPNKIQQLNRETVYYLDEHKTPYILLSISLNTVNCISIYLFYRDLNCSLTYVRSFRQGKDKIRFPFRNCHKIFGKFHCGSILSLRHLYSLRSSKLGQYNQSWLQCCKGLEANDQDRK